MSIQWAQPGGPFAILITSAQDAVPPGMNLLDVPITQPSIAGIADVPGAPAVQNNAVCSGGAGCNATTGVGCSLPCLMCASGRTDELAGLTCPGAVGNGKVHFADNRPTPDLTNLCEVDDESVVIEDQITWTVNNDCEAEPPIVGQACSSESNVKQEVGANLILCENCPFVEIDKVCETVNEEGKCTGEITVTASNRPNAGGTATNCTVTDVLDPDGVPSPVILTPDGAVPFDLAPGEARVFTATVPVEGNIVDEARIVCDPPVSPPTGAECVTEATARDVCRCEEDENYKCYAAKYAPGTRRLGRTPVGLEDQFRTTTATLVAPYQFCNPVSKDRTPTDGIDDGDGILNPDGHLMCYKFTDRGRTQPVPVAVTDQFGTEELQTGRANVFCVPALKNCVNGDCNIGSLEELLNHYQCYDARALDPAAGLITPDPVGLADQFTDGLSSFPDANRRFVCNPTAKNGGFVPFEDKHLKCYDIADEERFPGTEVDVIDQFGSWKLRIGQARQLCEEADKERLDRRPVRETQTLRRR